MRVDQLGRTEPPVLEMHDIRKQFGPTVAVADVSLTVGAGERRALLGRNGAGKSTLVSMMTGLRSPDAGVIRFAGEPAPDLANREAWRRLVACVYQKSTIVPGLSVAENLFINRQGGADSRFFSWRAMRAEASETLARWSIDVDPRAEASSLSVEDRQLVEIARSLSLGARFVVLDEPTAQLDRRAIDRLFGHISQLREAGVTFLYISHHLEEIYEICDTVTVLRDAREVLTTPVAGLSRPALIEALTGEALADSGDPVPRARIADQPVVLSARGLGGSDFHEVDLDLHAGEVVGLAGIIGSGKVSLAEAIAGIRPALTGTVTLDDVPLRLREPADAIAAGIGCVPQDRHHEGFIADLSIAENATMSDARSLTRFALLDLATMRRRGDQAIRDLDIRAHDAAAPVSSLSGGNQQKVVMARALATNPRVLVLINPTAGVDVKSKEALMAVAERAGAEGRAVVVVSDELADLRICDRVIVMFEGRSTVEIPWGWTDSDLIAAIEGVAVA